MKDKSKGKSVKASKTRSRDTRQLKKDAASIFDIKYEIGVLIIEEIDGASIIERHKELFAQAYTIAAREPNGDISELERILDRLDAGEQLADAVEMRETGQPKTTGGKISDLSKKERNQLEQAVLAQEKSKIEKTSARTIKQAILNVINEHPILIYNISAALERTQQKGGATNGK
jgi:hypothetical protein